jgi:dihydrofolate synthase / folylpolyglutamate synthase
MSVRERLFALEQFGIKLGLANITALIDALGRPDRAYPTVHIAGTNGKGSVTAMVERGLRAAGHRTGRYTSPHLSQIEERIAIDGAAVGPAVFDDVTAAVLTVVDELMASGVLPHPPTFFEVTTAIALETFRRAHVTAAVVEVGLGGRFDATNIVTPHATAITSIDLDHERHLGRTLPDIAAEKAGIIKPGVPVVTGPMRAEAFEVIAQVARSCDAPLQPSAPGDTGTPLLLALNGRHQADNAAVAVSLLKLCDGLGGRAVTRDHVVTALTDVTWPARLEWLRTPESDFLIDAAHNPAGAHALAQYVLQATGPLPMVFGVMQDKDVAAMVRALAPAASQFIVSSAPTPRAMDAAAVADIVRREAPSTACESEPDVERALAIGSAAGRCVVAGSIFLVGPVRALLLARGAAPVQYPSGASRFFLR